MKIVEVKKNRDWMKIALQVLNGGGLIIYPTETCYGVGVDTTNKKAVTKLLIYKKRLEGKAISIAVADQIMASKYVDINRTARNLYANFLPGPLTVISKSKGKVDKRLEAENHTLGIRMPDYHQILDLVQEFGKPITATSANSAGKKTPYSYDDVINNLSHKQRGLIDLFLDGGELPYHPPSTVVDTTLNDEWVLRQGEIKFKVKGEKVKGKSRISKSEKETQEIATKLIKDQIAKGLNSYCIIFSLQGELGSGKTQFAKGIGRALGIKKEIISPTFNIVNEYAYQKGKIIHIDTWRLYEEEDFKSYLPEKDLSAGNIIVIEWGEKIFKYLKELSKIKNIKIVTVNLAYRGFEKRVISCTF